MRFLWWLRHGAIGPMEATFLKVNVDWLDFWIDTFNAVVRLSKVKQLAILFISLFLRCPAAPVVLVNLGNFTSATVKPFRTARNFFLFINAAFRVEQKQDTWHVLQAGPCLQVWCFLLVMVFWWGQTYCASNLSEFEQLFMPGLTWQRSRLGVTHGLLG